MFLGPDLPITEKSWRRPCNLTKSSQKKLQKYHSSSCNPWPGGLGGSHTAGVANRKKYSQRPGSDAASSLFSEPQIISTYKNSFSVGNEACNHAARIKYTKTLRESGREGPCGPQRSIAACKRFEYNTMCVSWNFRQKMCIRKHSCIAIAVVKIKQLC